MNSKFAIFLPASVILISQFTLRTAAHLLKN